MRTVSAIGILSVVLFCFLLFSSCDLLEGSDSLLEDTQWTLTLLNGRSLVTNTNITLEFEEKEVGGFAGCNQYGGRYSATSTGALSVGDLAKTEQLCLGPPGVMGQEETYVKAFIDARGYRIRDKRLELENAEGKTILIFEWRE